MDLKTFNTIFRTEALSVEQVEAIDNLRHAYRALAELLQATLPETNEKVEAMRSCYESMKLGIQAIEFHGVSHTVSPILVTRH